MAGVTGGGAGEFVGYWIYVSERGINQFGVDDGTTLPISFQ